MSKRLTEKTIRSTTYTDAVLLLRDSKLPGFMVAINKTTKSFKIQADLYVGEPGRKVKVKTVRKTLGLFDTMSLEEARAEATKCLAMIKNGIDPNKSYRAQGEEDSSTWTVAEALDQYIKACERKGRSERHVGHVAHNKCRYLRPICPLRITSISKSQARNLHEYITDNHGPIVANRALGDLRAAYNYAFKRTDYDDYFRGNPVKGVDFNPEQPREEMIEDHELPNWWTSLLAIENPLRREMHMLTLYSGLRPGSVAGIERNWISLSERKIAFPRLKSGRPFLLPLSHQMVSCIERAMVQCEIMFPNTRWLFSTRSAKERKIIPIAVWREKKMPGQTGHILRHTHRTTAQRIGIDALNSRLLLDHKLPGIDEHYVHSHGMFSKLISDQQAISDEMDRYLFPEAAPKRFKIIAGGVT